MRNDDFKRYSLEPCNINLFVGSLPRFEKSMIMDVAHHKLFGPPRIIDECELQKHRQFLHFKFDNKGIDAVNINNTLNHKNLQSCIPP